MGGFDVHVHLLTRHDAARLQLMPAADEREVVDDEEIALTLETSERGGAEAGAREGGPGVLAGGIAVRRVVAGRVEQLGSAKSARDVGENPRLVDVVADAQLVESAIVERRGPVAHHAPQRTAEGLPRFERLERRR